MYFVFFEWMDNLIKWCSKQGGKIYWAWISCLGVVGGIAGYVLGHYGFTSDARKLLGVALIVYIAPIPLVYYFEKKGRV